MSQTKLMPLFAGLATALSVAGADVATGFEINLGFFYLVPIAIVTWWVGRAAGIALGAACAIGMFVVDNHVTRDIPFPSHELIPYWNAAIRAGYFVVFAWILGALRQAHERERRQARRDHLTGLANGQEFAESTRRALERSRRNGEPVSLAYIDCDNFKEVNDLGGHAAGDDLLREIAVTMRRILGDSATVARLGGDEFAVLLAGAAASRAPELMAILRRELLGLAQGRWPVTYSIGVVTFLEPPTDAQAALRESDRVMYSVKKGGKDRIAHQVLGRQ